MERTIPNHRWEVIKKLRMYRKEHLGQQTLAEKQFEDILKSHASYKYKIIPQRIFFLNLNSGYIVDFYIPKLKLAFEVDGDNHKYQTKYDNKRTKYLESRDIKVFRIKNKDVNKIEAIYFINDCIAKQERLLLIKERHSLLGGKPNASGRGFSAVTWGTDKAATWAKPRACQMAARSPL